MKILLILTTILIGSHSFAADETDKISIITPLSYDRTPGKMQNTKAGALVWAGDLFNAADVGENIQKTLGPFRNDLATYFPNGEMDRIVKAQVDEVNRTIVKGDMTDEKLIQVNKYFGNHLVAKIFDRILEKQGVSNPARRVVWGAKLLTPFNACVNKATNGYYAAAHCMSALTKSLVPTAGIGIVYEMSKANFASSIPAANQAKFNADLVQQYKDCMPKTEAASSDVMNCAVKSMKTGLVKVADTVASKTIADTASSANAAKAVKAKIWPSFNQCVDKVSPTDKDVKGAFFDCLDGLTQNAGVELVKDKILNTATIKAQFGKSELDKLAADKADFFKKCTDNAIKNNLRKDGMLDIQGCQDKITNDVTYKVMINTFSNSAKDNLKEKDQILFANEAGKRALDSCWKDDMNQKSRDKCLKNSVIIFSKHIAAYKLDAAIPDGSDKSSMLDDALDSLKSCLEKNLPSNISEATNTNEKLSACTDKLTRDTALKVAENEVRKTLKGKMSNAEIDKTVANTVKRDFASCIGNKPSDSALDSCSDKLKVGIVDKILDGNINQYLGNRPGIDLSKMRSDIKAKLMTNFKQCLGKPNKDQCTDELLKDANKTIVVAFGRTEASVQLNADKLPSKLDPVENDFVKCTETNLRGDKLSNYLDECNKKFAIEFAKVLGNIKLKYLLEKALGSKTLEEQKDVLDGITKNYNSCLNNLYKYKMSDNLTDKITVCTKDLENKALGLVKSNLNDWMSSEQKDAATLAIKQQFAGIVPCLSVLLPSSPYSQSLQSNTDSILKPVAQLLAQYIDYNPDNAKSNLDEIIKKLKTELSTTGNTEKAKTELVNLLYQNGALDQFIKSMVRGKVKDAFASVPDSELPKAVKDSLITRQNFDAIFNSPEGKDIKDFVFNSVLKPVLAGADMKSPLVATSLESVNSKVVKMLIMSPKFGDVIVKSGIQAKIDDMGGFKKFVVRNFYGKDNLNWDAVRTSELGRKAEEYIKDNLLTPQFTGKTLSPADQKRISEESEKLVTEAVKRYEAK